VAIFDVSVLSVILFYLENMKQEKERRILKR
jgi:hypothetical protein